MSEVASFVYAERAGRAMCVHLWRPGGAGAGPRPVVLHLHGGGWRSGAAADDAPLDLLDRGYAIAAAEYRFSRAARFPAQVIDATAAARWLADHATELGLDAGRIAVHGVSAGGHLAAILSLTAMRRGRPSPFGDPPAIRACVDLYGPTDFNALLGSSKRVRHGHARAPEVQLIGGPIQRHPARVAEANPIGYVHRDAPPTLIVQGEADDFVPPGQSRLFAAALRGAGGDVRLIELPGAGHGGAAFGSPAVRSAIGRFLDERLGLA